MKFFKHKSEMKVPKYNEIKEYLFTSSVQSSGAINYHKEDRMVITQNDKKYAIFKVEYINPNGIDIETDIENQSKVNELVKSMIHSFKTVDMNIVKNGLNKNIEECKELLKREDLSEKRRDKIQESLDVMKFYNDEKYVTSFLYISLEDLDIFCKLAPTVFHIERLNEDSVVETLSSLNNDMQ